MNDAPKASLPRTGRHPVAPDRPAANPLDAQLRSALSAPEGAAERLVQKALEHDAGAAPERAPLPWRLDRTWTMATAAVVCLALLWGTSFLWRPSDVPSESSVHLAENGPVPKAGTASLNAPRRHLRLSNTGDVVELTAPSGNTLLIVASTPTSRR